MGKEIGKIFELKRGWVSGTIKKGVVGKTVRPSVLRINIPLGRRKKFVTAKKKWYHVRK